MASACRIRRILGFLEESSLFRGVVFFLQSAEGIKVLVFQPSTKRHSVHPVKQRLTYFAFVGDNWELHQSTDYL